MKKLILLVVAFGMAFALAPSRTAPLYAIDGDEVTVTGCVVRGTDDDDEGFLLTNVLPASIDMSTRAAARAQGTAGSDDKSTLPGASSVIYWLDDLEDDDDLPDYAGKRVEVRGEVEGEIDRGEMEIERDGDWVKIDVESDGKKVKTRIPYVSVMPNPTGSAVGTSGGLKDDEEIELKINVRKIDVKDIRIVSGTCGQ